MACNNITEDDIRHWIQRDVWTGEYDEDDVALMMVEELGEEGEFDADWLRELIRNEFAAKLKAKETWPEVTDYDRLDRAFAALREQGIIAVHIAGFTQSEGLWEVEELYLLEGGEDSDYAGHCFYTSQDQERALREPGMYIGCGHLSGDDAKGVEVGHLLRRALEAEGFTVEWNGSIQTRLYVTDFRYQRRSPRNP